MYDNEIQQWLVVVFSIACDGSAVKNIVALTVDFGSLPNIHMVVDKYL